MLILYSFRQCLYLMAWSHIALCDEVFAESLEANTSSHEAILSLLFKETNVLEPESSISKYCCRVQYWSNKFYSELVYDYLYYVNFIAIFNAFSTTEIATKNMWLFIQNLYKLLARELFVWMRKYHCEMKAFCICRWVKHEVKMPMHILFGRNLAESLPAIESERIKYHIYGSFLSWTRALYSG